MAENEILIAPLAKAGPWKQLAKRIDKGESFDKIFPAFQHRFYSALRNVFEKWKECGVDPKQFFEAALRRDPAELQTLLKLTGFNHYSRLLIDIAAEPNHDMEMVLRSFLSSVFERVRALLRLDCREDGIPESFFKNIKKMREDLVRDLMKDPFKIPPRPADTRSIDEILGESLLDP